MCCLIAPFPIQLSSKKELANASSILLNAIFIFFICFVIGTNIGYYTKYENPILAKLNPFSALKKFFVHPVAACQSISNALLIKAIPCREVYNSHEQVGIFVGVAILTPIKAAI
ncbi:MAG: hypothetical protein LBL90_12790 [Prevotellaceae bacterium]|jgi:hypothetical protein|nr:hypothetical protein [Prevotellaceae bacterium]